MSIHRRILLWFIIPFILLATIASVVYYFHVRKTLKQNIFDQLEIASEALKMNIHTFIEAKRGRVIDFSSDGFIRDVTEKITMKEHMVEYYTSALNNHLITNKKSLDTSILDVCIIGFNDRVIASTNEVSIGEVVSTERFITEETVSGVFAGEPYYDTRLKAFLIDFSTVLLSRIGREPIGVIVNRIKIEPGGTDIRDIESALENSEKDYSKLIAVNKVRITDFGSDGFIRDTAEEIVKYDERVFYYADLLNNYLYENYQPLDPDLLSIFIVNLDGQVVSSTEIGQIGRDVSGEAYFTKTMKRGSCISDLYHRPDFRQKTFFNMARLLRNKTSDKTIGIIVNRYRGDYFEMVTHGKTLEIVKKTGPLEGMGETGEFYIVNSDKLMVTGSRFIKDAVFKQVVDTEGVRAAFDNGRGMIGIYPDYRGVPVVGVSRYIEELDWVVLAEKDVSEAFASLVYLRNYTVIVGIMGFIVFVSVAFFISKGIIKPVKELVVHSHRIANGDLTAQITVKSKDEIGLLASSLDTMRIKVAKLLKDIREAKRDWESTFDSVKEIIIIYGKDRKITKCNNELLSRLNVRPEDIIGKRCYEVLYCNEKEMNEQKRYCEVIKTFKTMKHSVVERESSVLHGIFHFSTFPRFDDKGKFEGVVQILRDITEQKRMQERLLISYKMASLGRLTAGVIHEVLNPLNIIASHVQLLLMEVEKGSRAEEDLKSIQEEIGRIVTISDGLLIFSRKKEIVAREVDTNNSLEGTISIVEPDMKLNNIRFIRKFDDSLPIIKADNDGLRQVFLNVITNARDAMPEGGALTISTQSVKVIGKSFVRIKFTDTGCGISSEDIDKLFDPFFTTKEVGKGTGLGLSISYGIIKDQGGTISVESEEGKGTTFIIDLPC